MDSEEGKNKTTITMDTMKKCFNRSKESKEKCKNLWQSPLLMASPQTFNTSQFYISLIEECKFMGCKLDQFISFHNIYEKSYFNNYYFKKTLFN